MKLVKDARKAWRWFSVQLAGVLIVLPQAWEYMPADAKSWVPDEWKPVVVSALGIAIIAGRLVAQDGTD